MRLMRMTTISISAKFGAKGTPPHARHVTFTCACRNIFVRLRFQSSPYCIFMCFLTHGFELEAGMHRAHCPMTHA